MISHTNIHSRYIILLLYQTIILAEFYGDCSWSALTFSMGCGRFSELRTSFRGSITGLAVDVLGLGVSISWIGLDFGVAGFGEGVVFSLRDRSNLLSLKSLCGTLTGEELGSGVFFGTRSKFSVVCILFGSFAIFFFIPGLIELRAPGRTTSNVGFLWSQDFRSPAVGALGPAKSLPDFRSYTIT